MSYCIKVYETTNGKTPFLDWLRQLKDRQGRIKIRARIDRAELGNLGQYRVLSEGVCEMKIDFGPGYRVYFGIIGEKCILLLCAGSKNLQQNDIKKAKEYFQDYQSREGEDE